MRMVQSSKGASRLLLGVLFVVLSTPPVLAFEVSMIIERPGEVTTTEMSHSSANGLDVDEHFLSRMQRHMRHISRASRHFFDRPMLGQRDIDRLFDSRSKRNGPFSALHRISTLIKDDVGSRPRVQVPPRPSGLLDILRMVRSIAKPVMQGLRSGIPPRGMVVIACDQSARHLCPQYHCWGGITSCLVKHATQVEPHCRHLLQQSQLMAEDVQKAKPPHAMLKDSEQHEDEDEAKTKISRDAEMAAMHRVARNKSEHPVRDIPSLSLKASMQRMHKSLAKDIRQAHLAIEREKHAHAADQKAKAKLPSSSLGDMNEGTPGYITGDIEAPGGKKDMGGWTMRMYTEEQQKRLHVDEQGRPTSKTLHIEVKERAAPTKKTKESKNLHIKVKEQAAPTKKTKESNAATVETKDDAASKVATLLVKHRQCVHEFVKTHWVLCLLCVGLLLVGMTLLWLRQRSSAALDDVYRATLTAEIKQPMQPMSGLHQV